MTAAILALIAPILVAFLPILAKWIARKIDASQDPLTAEKQREARAEQDVLHDQVRTGPALETSAHAAADLDELDRMERVRRARENTSGALGR